MNEQPKYRMLEVGEIIQEGDQFFYRESGSSIIWREVFASIGMNVLPNGGKFRRPIAPESPELPNGWRSMDSAPKDGSWILVWYPNRKRSEIARWESDKYRKKPKPYWHTAFTWGVIDNRNNPPSHWQPLPKGPTE